MPDLDYSDQASPSESESGSMGEEQMDHDDDTDSASAVIPKSLLAGKNFKPGDEVIFKIDSIHDDEVIISYAPEKKGGDEGEMSEMDKAKGMMDSYAKNPDEI